MYAPEFPPCSPDAFFWNWVKNYLGPVSFMELSEKAEKTGRKRRRKRIKPISEDEDDR